MANLLAKENSPYLLQHADNPVNWFPWGKAALNKAQQENKPIFLSIGYAACHWCHVMAHESFENQDIADFLNENFINIKVDREERPDIDNIYMNAVVSMTGQGGWPLSVFLTPSGQPFYGGTYFPPQDRYNIPSFKRVLLSVVKTWKDDRSNIEASGEKITAHLRKLNQTEVQNVSVIPADLDDAAKALANAYDWEYGGWGNAPKFPQPMTIEFLLRRASRGDQLALDISLHTLKEMSKGGMYDVIGGGFSRYSTDNSWLIPHFEKMLYDNAQLALVYLYAHLLTGDPHLRNVCIRTLDFIKRELTDPLGGFYCSLDADSEGVEGLYYTWDREELQRVLSTDEFIFFSTIYEIKSGGNFEGRTVLQRSKDITHLSKELTLPYNEIASKLNRIHEKLLHEREKRVHPGLDDKVLVAWNGLALTAFSEAAKYLKIKEYAEMAIRNAGFIVNNMRDENGRLLRSWRDGKAAGKSYLEDYAALISGFIALYELDGNPDWYGQAFQLTESMISLFEDSIYGFYDTGIDHEELLLRPKDEQDNATPSGNALAANALLRMGLYEGNANWNKRTEKMLGRIISAAKRYPTAFGKWLCATDFFLSDPHEVVIVGEPADPNRDLLVNALWGTFRPDLVAAISDFPIPQPSPPLLSNRNLMDKQATAYVCRSFVCKHPVNTVESFQALLQ